MQAKRPKLAVLCVDLHTVGAIAGAFGRSYEMLLARDAASLLRMLSDDTAPAALLIDNTVPQISAIEILQAAMKTRPDVRRVLISDYCDLSLIAQGLHTGAVERIVYKPVDTNELIASVGVPAGAVSSATLPPANRAAG